MFSLRCVSTRLCLSFMFMLFALYTTDGQGIFICWCLCIVSAPKERCHKMYKVWDFFLLCFRYYIIYFIKILHNKGERHIFILWSFSFICIVFACLPYTTTRVNTGDGLKLYTLKSTLLALLFHFILLLFYIFFLHPA